MSHRKFLASRHNSMGFTPKERSQRIRRKCKAFSKDRRSLPPHLTVFLGYKAGMTHIVREVDRPRSKVHKRGIFEPVTILEYPPMVFVLLVGYAPTAREPRTFKTVWAEHFTEECRLRFYKDWYTQHHQSQACSISSMSHRKFLASRHNSMGFTPKERSRRIRRKCKAFSKDRRSLPPHLTVFLGYKAGMTHIVREVDRPRSKVHKRGIFEPVTILECPPMVFVLLVGYAPTAREPRTFKTVWAEHFTEECRRRFYKDWCTTGGRLGEAAKEESKDISAPIKSKGNASTKFTLTAKNIISMGGFPQYGEVRNDYVMINYHGKQHIF
ncbi:hypothetical protein T265_06369 [Opisthorchis viverrini]|uniref:Ribosomal protein L3 n=1 Tax=Opisthorchis viverrini TaxID=6198 RepID=A0A074ZKT4_OPIVI|nr:hypothetical protein T265_06369 [Opisthorchis viverrini]KER26392.1 hypothetical protein T265_06369 [Opisthorchis viverrini]